MQLSWILFQILTNCVLVYLWYICEQHSHTYCKVILDTYGRRSVFPGLFSLLTRSPHHNFFDRFDSNQVCMLYLLRFKIWKKCNFWEKFTSKSMVFGRQLLVNRKLKVLTHLDYGFSIRALSTERCTQMRSWYNIDQIILVRLTQIHA